MKTAGGLAAIATATMQLRQTSLQTSLQSVRQISKQSLSQIPQQTVRQTAHQNVKKVQQGWARTAGQMIRQNVREHVKQNGRQTAWMCSRCEKRGYATVAATSKEEPVPEIGKGGKPRTAMFFPGQGVQRVGMIKPWLDAFPQTVKPLMEEIDDILQLKLTRVIESGTNDELNATENSQPAIMATSILVLRVLESEFKFDTRDRVDIMLGHSLGEFAALVAAGNLQYADALKMVRQRAEVMARCAHEAADEVGGEVGMVALLCEPDRLDDMIVAIHEFLGYGSDGLKSDSSEHVPAVQQVLIANINSKNQIVLSGTIARIKTLLTNLKEFGGHDPRAVQLKSDCPFHSPLLQPAAEVMQKLLRAKDQKDLVTFPGVMPCISNVTARPFQSGDQLKDLLARSCVETVLWWDSIKYCDRELKVRRWIGIGPGKVGRNLVGKEVGMKGAVKGGGVWGITDPKEVEPFLKALSETDHIREPEEEENETRLD